MRYLLLFSLLGFGCAHAGARAGGTCQMNHVDAQGRTATSYECARVVLDRRWRHDNGWSSGRRVEAKVMTGPGSTTGVTTQDGAMSQGSGEDTAEIVVELANDYQGRALLVRYTPQLGAEEIDEVVVNPDGRQIAIVFEPHVALRDHPGQKLRTTVLFDVGARLAALP